MIAARYAGCRPFLSLQGRTKTLLFNVQARCAGGEQNNKNCLYKNSTGSKKMKKTYLGFSLLTILAFTSGAAFAQVEQVTSMTVSNPAAMIANIDFYVASGEGQAQSVTMLRHLHDGVDPSTHTIVAIFDDLDTLESSMDRRANSAAWAAAGRAGASVSKVNSSALAIQRQTWGDDKWEEGDYLAAVLVNAADGATWIAAVDNMMGSIKFKNPGMLRIVRLRGGPSSHAVLLVASSYAELVTFQERVEASDEFATMRGATKTSVVGTTYYKVAKVWNP